MFPYEFSFKCKSETLDFIGMGVFSFYSSFDFMLTDSPPMIQNNIVFDNTFDTEDSKSRIAK